MNRACPVCGGADAAEMHRQRFVAPDGHPLADGYSVVRCGGCGMVYADIAAPQSAFDRYYADRSKYADGKTSTGAGETPADARRLSEAADRLSAAVPDRAARVADIGCAAGGLLAALRERGYSRLTGVDPSPACVAATAGRGFAAAAGTLHSPPTGAGPFDAVVLSHVLEHVLDLRGALAALRTVLADGGRVFAEVPDATRYADHLAAPFQDFNTEHINHFSTATLARLFAGVGFAPEAEGRVWIDIGQSVPYPAAFGVFRRLPDGVTGPVVPVDATTGEAVSRYIADSARLLAALDARLREQLRPGEPVVVWGTGQLAMKLLGDSALADCPVAAFIDGNPVNHGLTLRGVRVGPPEAALNLPHPIVVTTTLHQASVVAAARRLGFTNRLVLLAPEATP